MKCYKCRDCRQQFAAQRSSRLCPACRTRRWLEEAEAKAIQYRLYQEAVR